MTNLENADPWIARLSIGLAALSILVGFAGQYMTVSENYNIKKYEITALEKRNTYTNFLSNLDAYILSTAPSENKYHLANGVKLETSFYSLLPFITIEERLSLEDEYRDMLLEINKLHTSLRSVQKPSIDEYMYAALKNGELQQRKSNISNRVLEILFGDSL